MAGENPMSCEAKAERIRSTRAPKIPSKVAVLGLENELFQAAAAKVAQRTGSNASTRQVFDHAVGQHLADLIIGLHRLGFRGGPKGKRRPRRINQSTWDALQRGATETGIAAPALLRACLEWTRET
jgi:hypothetical protein